MPPLGKPMRTYPFGVKIIQGVDIVNSSAKIQFQVNRSIFVGEMKHYVFACYVMFSFACCIFAASENATSGIIAEFECFERTWQWQ